MKIICARLISVIYMIKSVKVIKKLIFTCFKFITWLYDNKQWWWYLTIHVYGNVCYCQTDAWNCQISSNLEENSKTYLWSARTYPIIIHSFAFDVVSKWKHLEQNINIWKIIYNWSELNLSTSETSCKSALSDTTKFNRQKYNFCIWKCT